MNENVQSSKKKNFNDRTTEKTVDFTTYKVRKKNIKKFELVLVLRFRILMSYCNS
jgi:hypothetical protein